NLAKGYVPEWNFDPSDPDIGSVLALLFANQMNKNIDRYNSMLERYRTELVNLMEISPLPAHPAEATVLMDVVSEAEEGVYIPAHSRLLSDVEMQKIIFETAFPVYLTPAKLRTMFMTSGKKGRVIPIKGDLKKKPYVEGVAEEKKQEVFFDDDDEENANKIKPFNLFQFSKEGLERQAVVLFHSSIFDVENETIYCRITGCPDFLPRLAAGEFRFLYYTADGFIPVENCQVMGNHILIVKEKANEPVMVDEKEYSVFVLEAMEPQQDTISFDSISFSSAGSPRNAEYVGNGTTDFATERFYLFGDRFSLFSECYIGMNQYFNKKDAKITMKFNTSYEDRYVGPSRQEEDADLRIIKRKPHAAMDVHVSYAYAEEISIEYYNGIGWKRLKCEKEYRRMFAERNEGEYEITFRCPDDWKESSTGAFNGRTLRIQLLRSDNCYYQPCIHVVPILSDLMVSYTYEERFEKPEICHVLSGTDKTDITKKLREEKKFVAFSKGLYNDTSLYLGFNRKFENGPVSLWWQLEGEQRNKNIKLRYYYSTIHGFKEMKVVDYTANLSRSGIVLFLPPSDMAMVELEGQRQCWLRVTVDHGTEFASSVKLKQISTNGVTVHNIETLDEEDYYLDEVRPEMVFPLRGEGILDAEVWVNELNEYSEEDMLRLKEKMPERVRIERNYLGEISEFFVKWEETDQFYHSTSEDRHYILDRMNGRILFGDGVRVRIPRNMDDVAFTVQLRCCNGDMGNVPANTITESSSNWLFVQNIYNPEAAYGGSDMETMERALQRGAGLLSSRGRFVTEQDYEREVLYFSDTIDKAAIIPGIGKDGVYREKMLHVVLLMKDYQKGKNSFYRLQDELKKHLLEHCELAIDPKELQMEEPIFVEISVDVWAEVMRMEDSFEIQTLAKDVLTKYLNPIATENSKGWNIGQMPRNAQIMMKLNSLKNRVMIRQVVVTAKYEDDDGVHEVALNELKVSPFMVVCNGKHNIHISPMQDVE
ncbi:MAG: hypothetical protein Q4C06_01720, partial [Bacillota bacterium]|nr:hypothetical protein [Bacillota bacterium]